MIYAPLIVVENDDQGFVVKATQDIQYLTMICEYSGQVMKFDREAMEDNDSLMEFITCDDIELVINPEKYCNLGRFISGINNNKTYNKFFLETIKFRIGSYVHILLYSYKKIPQGETLYYNYNNGEISDCDTRKFI